MAVQDIRPYRTSQNSLHHWGSPYREVLVKGGKPPYKVEAIYGKDKAKKPTQEIAGAGESTKFHFDKNTDWPLPLSITVKDGEGTNAARSVQIDESLLIQAGFKKPQGQ